MNFKKFLSLLLTLVMFITILPQVTFAQDEYIDVTLKFDASCVSKDLDTLYNDLLDAYIISQDTTNLPSDITLSVKKGSSVQEILTLAKEKSDFTEVGIKDDFVTQIGYVGNEILENLVSISVGDYFSSNIFYCAGWSFYINDIALSSSISNVSVNEDNAVIEGRYSLCTLYDSYEEKMIDYGKSFIYNYNKLEALTNKDVDTSSFSQKQKETLDLKMADAKALLDEIYNEASLNDEVSSVLLQLNGDFKTSGGMWIGYIEKKGTSLWGSSSPIEKLETMIKELESAISPLPENLLSELYITTLLGTFEDNLIRDFKSDKFEYVIKDYTLDNILPQHIKLKGVLASEDASVKITLNGEEISLTELSDNWKQYRSLDWENNIFNTFTFTITPPEGSALKETKYSVKIYSEITDNKKISIAKELLTWDKIKGLNSSQSEIKSSLNLPSKIEIDDIGEVSVSWSGYDETLFLNDGTLIKRSETDTPFKLIATLTSGEKVDTCDFDLVVKAPSLKEIRDGRVDILVKNIASSYTEKTTYWEAMDMGAYKKYAPETKFVLSDNAKQEFINESIKLISKTDKDTDLAKAILALTSQGKDAKNLYKVNNNNKIDAIKRLNKSDHSPSAWSAPYTLMVYNINEYKNREKEINLVNALISSQGENGAWDEYGTIDTTANAISGLSFYLNDEDLLIKEKVNTSIENALNYLSSQQNSDGSFSDTWNGRNSNSTAMVAIALCASGVDVENDTRFVKEGNTIIDGLLSFALDDNTGFGHIDNTSLSDYSTEQSFRALIALLGVITTKSAYNVCDFNGIDLTYARATGVNSSVNSPSDPQGDKITVTLTIKTDEDYFLNSYKVSLSGDGATVYHAFIKGCSENDISYKGADEGYVSSIAKGSKDLGEFDHGKNSGWLYELNGKTPSLGIKECSIKNGDKIKFYYTKDYTKASGVVRTKDREDKKDDNKISDDLKFKDISESHWAYDAILYVNENSLIKGIDEETFAPDDNMTRAMIVTILHRLEKEDKSFTQNVFEDIGENEWYTNSVIWAKNNNIVSGITDTLFYPYENATYEQMVTIMYRYAKLKGYDVNYEKDEIKYKDAKDISPWAQEAFKWAIDKKIVNGTPIDTLSPKKSLTRAEFATILMRFCKNIIK